MTEAWPTVIELAKSVRSGETRAVDLAGPGTRRRSTRTTRRSTRSFMSTPSWPADSAAAVDAKISAGRGSGPLAGVPFGIKDLEDCAGMPTSKGSLLFQGRPPVGQDSVHVGRLRAAGAVPVGKTAAPSSAP